MQTRFGRVLELQMWSAVFALAQRYVANDEGADHSMVSSGTATEENKHVIDVQSYSGTTGARGTRSGIYRECCSTDQLGAQAATISSRTEKLQQRVIQL
ncbi:hypothetical protein VNO80_18514 [Phaseolus coccineus]|uniref:Uncharacterized protein n=1 Tax=Phaseolus coccineus TaxID=3886 RepID=A0AAN9MKK1_PHACN